MNLAAVTRADVLAAIAQCDALGRRKFLKQTGFGPARTYFIDHGGRLYDSKAIMGVAHGLGGRQVLAPADFTGGEQAVARPLEALGFQVIAVPNPNWTREEIILACELVADNGWRQLEEGNARVKELSQLLQSTAIHTGRRHPDFRNPAGVARKTWNIVKETSNGNRLDREVFDDFRNRPDELRAEAAQIRQRLLSAGTVIEPEPESPAGRGFDRSYRGKPAEGLYPPAQATSPAAKEAAAREHDDLCRRLIEFLQDYGIAAGELVDPPVDVAWLSPTGQQMIVEVKSCTGDNDLGQLRLGLGQILEYRHRVSTRRGPADAVLLMSRVLDPTWFAICADAGVALLAGDDPAGWAHLVKDAPAPPG